LAYQGKGNKWLFTVSNWADNSKMRDVFNGKVDAVESITDVQFEHVDGAQRWISE